MSAPYHRERRESDERRAARLERRAKRAATAKAVAAAGRAMAVEGPIAPREKTPRNPRVYGPVRRPFYGVHQRRLRGSLSGPVYVAACKVRDALVRAEASPVSSPESGRSSSDPLLKPSQPDVKESP